MKVDLMISFEMSLVANGYKKKHKLHATTVDDKNDLGNGWTSGSKKFNELWVETEDAEFEVIPPLMISDKNVQEGDEKDNDAKVI